MNDCCFTLAVRQRRCENGIRRETDNVYTNIQPNSTIPLGFGYSLTFVTSLNGTATIQISNPDIIPNVLFNIPNGSYKIFDLPIESGSMRVYVGVIAVECCNAVACCCNNI